MKIWVVFCCVVLVKAEPPHRGSYGAPAPVMGLGQLGGYLQDASVSNGGGGGGGYSGGSSGSSIGISSSAHLNGGGSSEGGQVRRYVSIHVAPDEPESNQNRIIRVPGNKDKHVNIIFVKAPSMSSAQNTEVILPEQPEHKTLVYVLVKKSEGASDIKIRAPQTTRPPKPEVFFIRYKNGGGGAASSNGGESGGGYGGDSNSASAQKQSGESLTAGGGGYL